MTTTIKDMQKFIERTEREFIGLLLSDLELVNRWIDGDLKIEYFEEEHQEILRGILKAYEEGFLLTHKTFRDSLKDNPIPKDRISLELAFNACCSAKACNGDYIALEKRIKKLQEHKIRKQLFGEWDAEEMRNMDNQELSELLHDTANKISKVRPSNNQDIAHFLEPYFEFPVDAMPKILQPIITNGSLAYTCPPDYIGVSLLTTLAGCIGRAYQIKITKNWIQPTAIWSILIGKPSTVKSSFLRDISNIIYRKEYQWNINYDHDRKEYEKQKQIYEKALAKWKKKENTDENPPEKPEEPVQKCVVASDTTVEAIVQRMKENPKGLMIIMDEIAGFFGGMNRYNMGNNESEFYNQTWSGGSFKVDRKSTGVTVVRDMYLSLCGTIQPVRFRQLLGGRYQDNGMAARILPCYPNPVKAEFPTAEISDENIKTLEELYIKFLDLELQLSEDWIYGAELKPAIINLTADGLEAFKKAYKKIVGLEYKYAIDNKIEGMYGKMRGYLARFSLVINLIRYYSDEIQSLDVDEDSVRMAEKLVYYFLAHAHRIWVWDNATKYDDIFKKIKRYAYKNNLEEIPIRKIAQLKLTRDTKELRNIISYYVRQDKAVWCDDNKRSFLLN